MPRKGLEGATKGSQCCMAKHAHHKGGDFTLGAVQKAYGPDLLLEPTHITAYLDFDIPKKRCVGKAVTTVHANRGQSRTIKFEGVNFLDVSASDVNGHKLEYTYDGKQISVTWEEPFKKGEDRQVAINYVVDDPITGLDFSYPDDSYPNRPVFAATDNETERARYWFPCVDFPTVRTTFDWIITSDASHTIVANGVLQEETVKDGRKTSHWKLDFPCPSYLTCVCVGEFISIEDVVDGMPIAYIAPKNVKREDLIRTFDQTPKMIRWLSNKVNRPFPFPKYYQIIFPGKGGAMENISLVTFDDIFLMDEVIALEWKISMADSVTIHEMAHSFFGDAVVCKYFEHSWLKESWATYMEACWLEDTQSKDDFRFEMLDCANRYFSECNSYVRPIVTKEYDHSWNLFDRHLYPGGAWRIHMLRKLMGDEEFWAAISEYLSKHHKSLVETEDFKRMLEHHSGRNLTKFFDQWIYSRGYPKVKATYNYNAEKKEAVITLEQTQKDEKKLVGLFDIEVEVELVAEDNTPYLKCVRLDDTTGKGAIVFSDLKAKPSSIRVNPDGKVLMSLDFNPGEEILNGTLTRRDEHTDVASRIWAALELIKIGNKSSIEKVRQAMRSEPYFGVRTEVASALGNKKHPIVVDTIIEMLEAEKEPRVLASLVTAHGTFREPRLRESLRKWFTSNKEGILPYRAQWSGYQALANHNKAEDIELFKKAAHVAQRFVSSGGLRALGRLHNLSKETEQDVFDFLKSSIAYGNAFILESVRMAAISAFSEFASNAGKKKTKQAVEVLVDLIREPNSSIKSACIEGLLTLGAKQALSAVRAVKSDYAHQYHPWFERKIRAFNKEGDSDTVLKLKKDVEELEARLRKLEDAQPKSN